LAFLGEEMEERVASVGGGLQSRRIPRKVNIRLRLHDLAPVGSFVFIFLLRACEEQISHCPQLVIGVVVLGLIFQTPKLGRGVADAPRVRSRDCLIVAAKKMT
jgi:hypothetical protein